MTDFEQANSNLELGKEVQGKLDVLTPDEAKGVNLTDANNQAKEALTNNKTVTETFRVNRNNFPGEHMNAVKNVFQNICGKSFDTIKMDDIYKLNSMQKSELAWEIAALKKGENFTVSGVDFYKLREYLETGKSMDIKSLNKAMNIDLDAKGREKVFKVIRNKLIDNAVNQYDLMRKKGDLVQIMQDIYTLAVGDLSNTNGIGGVDNIGREYFAYDLENSDHITNSLRFGPYNSPAQILISAHGINKSGGSLTISLGDEGSKIVWNYTKDGLNLSNENRLLNGVIWENGVLTIPKEPPYSNNHMEIKIESKNKDEIMFNFLCKNASITPGGIAESLRVPSAKEEFEPGVYELAEGEKQDFLGGINSIIGETRKTKKTNIPVVFEVGIDKIRFSNEKALDGKDIAMLGNIKNKYSNNSKLIQKIQQEFDEFSNKIDLSNKFSPDQINAQTRLAKLRFLEALDLALTNYTFRKQLETGKININSILSIGTRKIDARIDKEEDLYYIKQ